MVGDGVVDVLAGRQAGTRTVFVSPRKAYVFSELERQNAWPDLIAGNLLEAVELIQVAKNGHRHAPLSEDVLVLVDSSDSRGFAL
jgi:predicted HAD superfamily phosphohydrolase YqeG